MSEIATLINILEAIEVSEDGLALFLDKALNNALSEASAATDRYGKTSTITLKISVEKEEHGKVAISATMDKKIAKGLTTPVKLYLDRKRNLSFENPTQPRLNGFDNESMRN